MKILTTVVFCALAFALGGCAVTPTVYTVSAPFDVEQAGAMMAEGQNTVIGNAFMRQNGGGVVSCAGSNVALIPATAYASERIRALYGNTNEGVSKKSFQFEPQSAAFTALIKTTICDSQGNFQFDKVADGEFFVVTKVTWKVGTYDQQGGNLMKAVKLSNKQNARVVLAG